MPENNIMVDLETMGTESDAAITAIGAIRFDITEGTIIDEIYIKVDLQSCIDAGLSVKAETIEWWMKQNIEARQEMVKAGTILEQALGMFTEYIKKGKSEPIVWGNGAAFDNVILKNAYIKMDIPVPWNYWNDRCFRTLKTMLPAVEVPVTGHHIAVEDARWQTIYLLKGLGVYQDDRSTEEKTVKKRRKANTEMI